ncbi:hypothetical protein [Halalkalibacter lacteus]|uniref:hypothetical protein n=1 Tax=Halalkalibacter lacteus TaxID=3090663 RepID=UPI002FC9D3BF
MGDLPYSAIDDTIEGLYDARTSFYETFLGRFLEIDADANISLGDLTNYGLSLEFQDFISMDILIMTQSLSKKIGRLNWGIGVFVFIFLEVECFIIVDNCCKK